MIYKKIRAASTVNIELFPFTDYAKVAHQWQDLEQRLGNTYLTNSWPWLHTWLTHYGSLVHPTFAFGMLEDQPIGAALITRRSQRVAGLPIPSVHLGTAGEPQVERTFIEYNRLLVEPEHLNAFASSLIDILYQQFRWSELHLDGFAPEHGNALVQAAIHKGIRIQVKERPSPTFDFLKAEQDGNKEVLSALGKSTRSNVRRSIRLFESTFGKQRNEWAITTENAKDILRELIDLHQLRWQRVKESGAFLSQRVQNYHADLIDALGLWPQGSLIVFRLKFGETTIGCLFSFVDTDGHVQFYKSGLAQFEDNRLKPGLVTHVACMTECQLRSKPYHPPAQSDIQKADLEDNTRPCLLKYDFLAGDSLYKDQLSNSAGTLIWAIAGRGPRSWFIEKARWCKDLLRQYQQTRS